MSANPQQLNRTGVVSFHDAQLSVWEEPGRVEPAWERQFKRDVFARIVQTLNRLGWACKIPEISPHDVNHYGGKVARWGVERRRFCTKGELKADLSISGRCIEFKMFQSVNCPTRPDHEGRYERDKEACMPYLMRLEMERTRRRIRDYLCSVFSGYTFATQLPPVGPFGLTAQEWVIADARAGWHFDKAAGRNKGAEAAYNNRGADGTVTHGARVYCYDYRGRMICGTAHYNLNNMWWVLAGRYGRWNIASFEIFTQRPQHLRRKNPALRKRRLQSELDNAVKAENFERAIVLRDLLKAETP